MPHITSDPETPMYNKRESVIDGILAYCLRYGTVRTKNYMKSPYYGTAKQFTICKYQLLYTLTMLQIFYMINNSITGCLTYRVI